MNIGYNEARQLYAYDCYVFHDVDLLPEDDRNIYSCPDQPRHMSASIDVMNYRRAMTAVQPSATGGEGGGGGGPRAKTYDGRTRGDRKSRHFYWLLHPALCGDDQ